jgi:hypothetical protein
MDTKIYVQPGLQEQIEALADKHSIQEILGALVETCHLKAEHLRANWQDEQSAKAYDRANTLIDNVRWKLGKFGRL